MTMKGIFAISGTGKNNATNAPMVARTNKTISVILAQFFPWNKK